MANPNMQSVFHDSADAPGSPDGGDHTDCQGAYSTWYSLGSVPET